MDNHSEEQRKKNMRAVKSRDTKIELMLRSELWERGLRYRKNVNVIIGKPDIVFLKKKIAVFCDSEFWHGFDWEHKRDYIKTNQEFWIKKIEKNIQRDCDVNKILLSEGWLVLRFWGSEIKCDCGKCADEIESAYKER